MTDFQWARLREYIDDILRLLKQIEKNTRQESLEERSSRITGFGIEGESK